MIPGDIHAPLPVHPVGNPVAQQFEPHWAVAHVVICHGRPMLFDRIPRFFRKACNGHCFRIDISADKIVARVTGPWRHGGRQGVKKLRGN